MILPKEKLTRAICPDCGSALIALSDITMVPGMDGQPDPLNADYIEALPLGWRDDQASLVLEVVRTVVMAGVPRDLREVNFDILCPQDGILEWDALQERVEDAMHRKES